MKKGWLFVSAFVSLIGFASAQSVISDIFAGIDSTLITLAILFVVFFAVLYFSTSKVFRGGNRAIPAVISLAVSLLIIYWINQSANVGGLFTGLGLSGDNLYTVGSIFLIGFLIFLFVKIKSKTFFVIGGILIAAAVIPGLIYSTTAAGVIGAAFVLLGIIFAFKKKRGIITPPGVNKPRLQFEFSGPRANWVSRKKAAANRAEEEARIRARMQGERKELGQERDLAGRAQAMAVANADYIQHEAKQKASMEALQKEKEAEIAQEQRQEQGLQNQVGAYLDSLRQSFQKLQEEYNALLRINSQDPKIKEVYNELAAVRSEIQRVMMNNKIRYKD